MARNQDGITARVIEERVFPRQPLTVAQLKGRRPVRFCWYLRFLSVVTKTSNPDSSAAQMRSPFESCDQPRSCAVTTAWPASALRNGAGVP